MDLFLRFFYLCVLVLACIPAFPQSTAPSSRHKWAVFLHGGAGVLERASMTLEAETNYRAGIKEALTAAAAQPLH